MQPSRQAARLFGKMQSSQYGAGFTGVVAVMLAVKRVISALCRIYLEKREYTYSIEKRDANYEENKNAVK